MFFFFTLIVQVAIDLNFKSQEILLKGFFNVLLKERKVSYILDDLRVSQLTTKTFLGELFLKHHGLWSIFEPLLLDIFCGIFIYTLFTLRCNLIWSDVYEANDQHSIELTVEVCSFFCTHLHTDQQYSVRSYWF